MNNNYRTDLSSILKEIANQLDISDTLYEEAVARYEAVGEWLGGDNSPLAAFSPKIYPQGSFALGTVTKRWGEDDEYDIDLVFEINFSKEKISQKALKNLVGDRIKENEVYRRMLDEEGRRCWTLVYSNDAKFHLDILPAIPDHTFRAVLKSYGLPEDWANISIAITDTTHPNYDRIASDWPRCNPKRYAAWFRSRMIPQFEAARERVAKAMKADPEAVPDYKVKTPLQMSIQLMKRNRDIFFEKKNDKPSTIILTTLAGLAYNNEFDPFEALTNIVEGMPKNITRKNGIPWVQNPVDPEENFADRWQDPAFPNRREDFETWHRKLQSDLQSLTTCYDIDSISEILVAMFGEKVTLPAVKSYKNSLLSRPRIVIPSSSTNRPNQPWGN